MARTKGSTNQKTDQWFKLGNAITNKHTARFNRILGAMNDEDFVENYIKVLRFFKPQLQSVKADVTTTIDKIDTLSDEELEARVAEIIKSREG